MNKLTFTISSDGSIFGKSAGIDFRVEKQSYSFIFDICESFIVKYKGITIQLYFENYSAEYLDGKYRFVCFSNPSDTVLLTLGAGIFVLELARDSVSYSITFDHEEVVAYFVGLLSFLLNYRKVDVSVDD